MLTEFAAAAEDFAPHDVTFYLRELAATECEQADQGEAPQWWYPVSLPLAGANQ